MRNHCAKLMLFLMTQLAGADSLSATVSTPYGSRIEAIIFDCDGVLVDTEYLKFVSWQEALSLHNIALSVEEYMALAGHSSRNILQKLKESKGIEIPGEVIESKNKGYRTLQKQGVPQIEEMIALAKYLAEEKENLGIKLGLASSAATAEILHNLEQIGLADAFDLVISGTSDLAGYEDPEGRNKPKPYIYLEAAKRLEVRPDKCLVFEDTSAGIEAAVSAGMIAVAVPNEFTMGQDFTKAKAVVDSRHDSLLHWMVKD